MQPGHIYKLLSPLYLLLWLALSLYLGAHHEPFADEAQSYLIARDASLGDLFGRVCRTEGTPPLWFLWLKLWLFFGLPYSWLYLTSVLPNFAAVALFVYKAPFSAPVRFLFPLTYYIFYQYNIIARSYALLFLALTVLALVWQRRREKTLACIAALLVLGSVSAHALILSGGLAGIWMWEEFRKYQNGDRGRITGKECAALGIFAVFAVYSLWLLWPDSENMYVQNYAPSLLFFLTNILYMMASGLVVSVWIMAEDWPLMFVGIIYFILACIWLAQNFRRAFFMLLLPNLLFMAVVPFKPWHTGILVMTVLFIFWQNAGNKKYPPVVRAGLIALFAVQLFWSIAAFIRDRSQPYSAAPAAYAFMQQEDIAPKEIALILFNTLALRPYLSGEGAGSYWDWRRNGFILRINREELLQYRAFAITGEFYNIFKDKMDKIQELGGYKRKIFPAVHYFGLQDKSLEETYYIYYRDKSNGVGK